MSTPQYSDQQVEQSLKNALAAGDHSAASLIGAELNRRRGGRDFSSLGPATQVPAPQGFMEDSGLNAFGRGIRENIGGGAGAAIGGAAGLKGGGAVGTAIGGPGIGTAIGAGIGGIGGGVLGAMFGGHAQQAMFPTSEDTQRILAADEQNHPNMSFAGRTAPYLATLKPSIGGVKSAFTKITPEMTALERSTIVGHRVGGALGAGLGGASEIAMPMINGQDVNPTHVLASTILGALFNEPNRLGRGLGMPSTPTLAEVRAQQMARGAAPPPASTAMVPFEQAPLIQTEVVNPRAIGAPETGAYPVGNTDVRFVQPRMLEGAQRPLELPANASNGADSVMPGMRQEQAASIQTQLTRLQERRASMVSRGVDKAALKAVDTQIKARTNALKGLQNETTIIAPPSPDAPAPIVESGVAVPPPDRAPVIPDMTPPMDPRMAARASGSDRIATGERPAFISADAITQAKLEQDAMSQSPQGGRALREQLSAQERPSIQEPPPPVANKGAIPTPDEAQRWDALVAYQEPIVKALHGEDLDKLGAVAEVKRHGLGDEAYRAKIIGNTHPDDLQAAINATSNPTPNEIAKVIPEPPLQHQPAEQPKAVDESLGKLPDSSVGDVGIVTRNAPAVDTPEVVSLRNQIAQVDEDIFNAKEDGDAYGQQGLEIARRRLQSKMDEAMNPTVPQSLGEKLRSKKVKVKGDKVLMPIFGISPDDVRRAWNGALEVAARLADTGVKLRDAAKQAAAWVRSNFPTATFKDEEFHRAVEADITAEMPAARRAGEKNAAHAAADQMDNNPDQFLGAADATPIRTYMEDVEKTMSAAKNDMLSGRSAKSAWQKVKDFNRHMMRGNQAALDDLANGSGATGRKSPALEKLNMDINGTRPGATGVGRRGLYDEVITRTKARTGELDAAYNGIRKTVDTLPTVDREAFLSNLVRWMKDPSYATKLRNQPEVLKAVETIRKVSRDIYNDLKANGIDVGDAGPNYFTRLLDTTMVKGQYDEFVNGMTKIYDMQWKQNDPGYVQDLVKARAAAKAYADASILGHEDIHMDGSDLNLSQKKSGDPDFFKARTFTGAAGDELDRTMSKFYTRNPFEALRKQINRSERRIGLAKAFGKVVKQNGQDVLDPTFKWRQFVEDAVAEGNEKLVPEVRERYQTMFGIGGNFNPKTVAFNQFTRTLGYYAYLPFSGINSLVEPTVMAMRLNKPVGGLFQAYGKTFRSMARSIKNMPLDYKEKLADAMGLAENATMQAARSLGKIDEQGMVSGRGLSNYMFLTGNSIVSNATSNAAVDIGMSAIRVALLDHLHGRDGNNPRIWLEELGIKKSDFDSVSKWIEGHVTDEARFGAVMDVNSVEAGMVRDALSKFAREARSMPDAGSKSKTFSNPAGSMLLSLQSFLYDFSDKVLGRNARQFTQGVKGKVHFDGDPDVTHLSPQERIRLMAPMALGMPTLLAANYGIAMVREALYPDPEKIRRDRERTNGEINWNRFTRSLSRTNALGPYDMLFNMFAQARYERDVAAMALGPYMGGVMELAKNVAALSGERNSGNTNTAERKAVRSAWNIGPKPLINMALASLPATRAMTAVAAGGIQLSSQRSVTEGAVDLTAGSQTNTRTQKKKPMIVP